MFGDGNDAIAVGSGRVLGSGTVADVCATVLGRTYGLASNSRIRVGAGMHIPAGLDWVWLVEIVWSEN